MRQTQHVPLNSESPAEFSTILVSLGDSAGVFECLPAGVTK